MKSAALKTSLTFHEKITAAYLHYVRGMSQEDVAVAMSVSNMGRVNEACVTIKRALLEQGNGATSEQPSEVSDAREQ